MDMKKVFLIVGALVALLLFVTGNAQVTIGGVDQSGNPVTVTAPDVGQEPTQAQVDEFVDQTGSMVPPVVSAGALAALATFIVNILKLTKLGPKLDGKSALITLALSIVLFVGFTVANLFGVGDQYKTTIEQVGSLLPPVFILITTFVGSKAFHYIMKWFDTSSFSLSSRSSTAATGARYDGPRAGGGYGITEVGGSA